MQQFDQAPVAADIQSQVTEISDKIGTVPSGSTVQGEIDTLNANLNTISGKLSDIVKIKKYSISITVSGNTAFTQAYSPSADSGYKIIGVAGYDIKWNHCELYGLNYKNGNLNVCLQNTSSNAMQDKAMDIYLLEIRT